MKRTKIVCTIGPASEAPEKLAALASRNERCAFKLLMVTMKNTAQYQHNQKNP